MKLGHVALALALLGACSDDAPDDRSNDAYDAAAASAADSGTDADAHGDMDADATSPLLDATFAGDADANAQPADGSVQPDGSAPPFRSDAGGSCLTTRTAPDPTLLYLPGKVFHPGATSGLADFEDTLLGYTAASGYFTSGEPTGWTLWSKSTGELIDDSELTSDSQRATGIFMHAAGERFLVRERAGGPFDLVLRDAADGHEVWRAGGWSPTGEKRLPRAGVSRDGSFVWAAAPSGSTTYTLFEAFHTDSTTPFLSFSSAIPVLNVFTSANEILVILGDSSVTLLRRFDRNGVEGAQVGPLPGQLIGTFADESHLITTLSGGDTRVYSRSGELKFQKPAASSGAGGIGNVFWLGTGSLDFYRLTEGTAPFRSFQNAVALADGQQVASWDRRTSVVLVTPDAAEEQTVTTESQLALFSRGQLIQVSAAGITAPSFAKPLGCGYTVTAADSTRLFISGSAAATYVYKAPFESPSAILPPASKIILARDQERFALRTSATQVTVYGPDFTAIRTVTVDTTDDISLSFQGARLGTSRRVNGPAPDTVSLHSEIIDVATGQKLHTVDQDGGPSGKIAPIFPLAPRFSPSGLRFAFSAQRGFGVSSNPVPTTLTFEGDTQLGAINGQVLAWIDDNLLIAYPQLSSIITAQGLRTAEPACDLNRLIVPELWISPNTYVRVLDGVNERCDLVANARTVDTEHPGLDYPVWMSDGPIGFFGAQTAYLRPHNIGVRIR